MDNVEFACRLTDSMQSKFQAIDDLDIGEIINFDEDLLIAFVFSYFVLSKDKLLTKNQDLRDPLLRLNRHVSDDYILELFSGRGEHAILFPPKDDFDSFVKNVGNRDDDDVISDSDYYLWCLDNYRDSFMHHGGILFDEVGLIRLINDEDDRRLFSDVPIRWFINYIESNPLSRREFSKYTIKGFYYNILEEDNHDFNAYRLLDNTIMYKVFIKSLDDSKINEKELTELIYDKFYEYSLEEVSLEDINRYCGNIPERDRRFDVKYLVSFYKAKEKVLRLLEEKYPNTHVDIRIDNRKYDIRKKMNFLMNNQYLNYQDVWNAYNSLFEKKTNQLLNGMYNLYNFIKDNQNTNRSRDELLIELSHLLLGDDSILSSDTQVSSTSLLRTKKLLKTIFYYVYGINTIVLNNHVLGDLEYLELLEDKCVAGRREKYKEHMDKVLSKTSDLDRGIKESVKMIQNYGNHVWKSNGENLETRQHLYSLIKDSYLRAFNELQILQEELDFKPFYTNRRNRLRVNNIHTILKERFDNAMSLVTDFTQSQEIRREKIDEITSLLNELKEIEKDFIFGLCDGTETLGLFRNCLAHPGRIDCNIKKNNCVYFTDYNENGNKSGIAIVTENDLVDIIYGSMESFKNNYGREFYKR